MPARILGTLLLVALAAACRTTVPPVSQETSFGLVRGESAASVEAVAAELELLEPRVREELIDVREGEPPEVWVQSVLRRTRTELSPDTVSGFTRFVDGVPVRIYLREESDTRWALGHELVHALAGESWDALPGVMSEGLADVISGRVSPDLEPEARSVRLLNASLYFDGMAFVVEYDDADDTRADYQIETWYPFGLGAPEGEDPAELFALDRWDLNREHEYLSESMYGLGYVVTRRIVDRVGLAGLHGLCTGARAEGRALVPVETLLASAGIEGEDGWRRALALLLGPREVREIHALLPRLFPGLVVGLFAERYRGELTADEFLEQARPRLVLEGGARVELASLEGLSERVRRDWRRR